MAGTQQTGAMLELLLGSVEAEDSEEEAELSEEESEETAEAGVAAGGVQMISVYTVSES